MSDYQSVETTSVMPSPFMAEEKIVARINAERAKIQEAGGTILSERRIRNTAFDRKGERTTWQVEVRWPRGMP